ATHAAPTSSPLSEPSGQPSTPHTPTPAPAPTATPTPPGDIILGRPARVLAPTGVNIRKEPGVRAGRVGYFASGILVRVLEGPVYADGYIWWLVDDGYGKSGWIAGGDGQDVWLSGHIGDPRPVNRPVRLGDRVTVSVAPGKSLTIRYEPGTRGPIARRVIPGTRLDVIDGPVYLDDMRWWKVRRRDGLTGWAAEGDGKDRWLTPME
ncbi:MAG: SH3 domain-containing protein, partial [Caldilineae bacterium]